MALPYSTQADVQSAAGGAEKLRQLSDVDRDNSINATEVSNAIARADSLINSYAKKRYAIPFDTVPGVINEMSAQIAVHKLKQMRNMLGDRDVDEQADRVQWLRDLSSGVVVVDESVDSPKSEFVRPRNAARPESKAVSRAKLKGYW